LHAIESGAKPPALKIFQRRSVGALPATSVRWAPFSGTQGGSKRTQAADISAALQLVRGLSE
jgi:hypothetical protein